MRRASSLLTVVFGMLILSGQVMADYWRLPDGRIMQTSENSTPPVAGAKRLQPQSLRPAAPQVQQGWGQQQVQSDWAQVNQRTPSRVVTTSPTTQDLGKGLHSDNCVFFARDRVPSLPTGMTDWAGKIRATNTSTPTKGSVAFIPYTDMTGAEIGHVAYVENVDGNTITLLEGNFVHGQITRRTATGTDLRDAVRQLKIAGFFDPRLSR